MKQFTYDHTERYHLDCLTLGPINAVLPARARLGSAPQGLRIRQEPEGQDCRGPMEEGMLPCRQLFSQLGTF